MPLKRVVLDVLVPHEPNIAILAEKLADLDGAQGVNIYVVEQDDRTKTLGITVEGNDLPLDAIRGVIEELGGALHSIDEVSAGTRMIDQKAPTREGE